MELFTYTFIQYAFLGGLALALLAGLLGPFVVYSKQSYASDMFAHVALAGIGGALLLNMGPWWGALPALLLVSTLLWWFEKKQIYSSDALAILFLSGGLALALAFVHLAEDQTFSFENYLFGSILTLTPTEILGILLVTIFVGLVLYLLWYPLIGATGHPSYRIPFNTRPELVKLLFLWLVALVVWIGIKTVGGLLIGAMLVIPSLVVRPLVQSFRSLAIGCTIVTVLATMIGLTMSVFFDIPPSSLIIGVLIVLFILQSLYSYTLTQKPVSQEHHDH